MHLPVCLNTCNICLIFEMITNLEEVISCVLDAFLQLDKLLVLPFMLCSIVHIHTCY